MKSREELLKIIDQCKKGNRHAQFMLYESFWNWSLTICRRYCISEEISEECAQDGFFKVFTKIHLYREIEPFQPWLKTIMIRTCIDHHRSNLKQPSNLELESAVDESGLPEVLVNMEAEELLLLIRNLPTIYQMTFNLYAIEGYDYKEIAEMLKVNIGSVKSNLFKARKKLKELLIESQKKGLYAG